MEGTHDGVRGTTVKLLVCQPRELTSCSPRGIKNSTPSLKRKENKEKIETEDLLNNSNCSNYCTQEKLHKKEKGKKVMFFTSQKGVLFSRRTGRGVLRVQNNFF